eukprot:SAG22_NODE_59_length_23617_cov_252.868144_4_plen_201_part_00
MIVDTHAYCFLPLDSARGYASSDDHLARVCSGNAGHHQPALRINDGAAGDSAAMLRDGSNFRLDRQRGRIVWDDPAAAAEGGAAAAASSSSSSSSYSKYFLPPNLLNLEYTPHSLDCEMHYARVDVALLHTNDMLVRDPSYYAEVCAAFPGRFRAMAPTREDLIAAGDSAAAVAQIRASIAGSAGLHAIKFHVNTWYSSE